MQGTKTNNALKIDMGWFKTDTKRTFGGQVWQLFSRFTWEMPQNDLGNLFSHGRNISGNVTDVTYYGGVTLVNQYAPDKLGWGLTLGSFINSRNASIDPKDGPMFELFRHEFGHTLQSKEFGPLYLPKVGLPSLMSAVFDELGLNNHNLSWFETDANRQALRYFNNHDAATLDPAQGGILWNSDDIHYPTKYKANWFWILSPLFF
jgi:hypothetical protein